MSTPTNQAAWLSASKQKPFDVKSIPFPSPSPTEIVIHNHAVAINPVDWKVQDYDFFIQSYPFVLGEDGAGTVHSVGSAVTGFAPGDRVLAHYNGLGNQQASNSSFATYAKTTQTLVAKIPDVVSFTDASVLPLAISTAAAGLFQKGFLELPFPLAGGKAQKTGKVLLVWGGSSSVGSAAIQLAVAAGVDVAATASARNHEFVKSLGAKYVFDHTSGSVVEDIVKGLQGAGEFAGVYDAISLEDTVRKTAEVTRKLGGKQLIATVLDAPAGAAGDVATKNVFAITIADNEVGPAVWGKFVPEALKDGSLKTAPDALVVGQGLEKIQEGCDKNKAGVSAKKVVVELA